MISFLNRNSKVLGGALIGLGVLFNPWLVGWLLSEDGRVNESTSLAFVIATQTFLIAFGSELIMRWFPMIRRDTVWPINAMLLVFAMSLLVAITCWGIDEYNRGHSHTILALSELEQITDEQREWTEDFYQRSLQAALKNNWFDFEQTMKNSGFQPDRVNRTHFPNQDYMFDGIMLDPERPEWLVYHDTPNGKALMALMFFTNELEEIGPTPGGPLALWHYHPYQVVRCAVGELWTVGKANNQGECEEGDPVIRTPEMLHVWFIEHPLGRFTEMKIV